MEDQLTDYTAEAQARPLQQAEFLLSKGMLGHGMKQLEDAEAQGEAPATVKWRLLDLYCQIGRPDKALEQLGSLNVDDPTLSTGPGTASYRQGLVNLLVGNYENAERMWERALVQLRGNEAVDALESVQAFLRGDPRAASTTIRASLSPNRVGNQASWEFEVGLCCLEAGQPKEAGQHFTRVLELTPNITARPLAVYYLTPPRPRRSLRASNAADSDAKAVPSSRRRQVSEKKDEAGQPKPEAAPGRRRAEEGGLRRSAA